MSQTTASEWIESVFEDRDKAMWGKVLLKMYTKQFDHTPHDLLTNIVNLPCISELSSMYLYHVDIIVSLKTILVYTMWITLNHHYLVTTNAIVPTELYIGCYRDSNLANGQEGLHSSGLHYFSSGSFTFSGIATRAMNLHLPCRVLAMR